MKIQIALADDKQQAALEKTGFWGKRAAGCLFIARDTGRILLLLRSEHVQEPHTWGMLSGALDDNEVPLQAVRREAVEELGVNNDAEFVQLKMYKHKSGFLFYNFMAVVEKEFTPKLDWENSDFEWVRIGRFPSPLHPGLKWLLRNDINPIAKAVRNSAQ